MGLSGLRLTRINTEVSLGAASVDIRSFDGTPEHQAWCRHQVESTLPQTLRNSQRYINDRVSALVLPIANEILGNLSLNDLIGIITGGGGGGGFPECNP